VSIRFNSYFSGAGLLDLGLVRAAYRQIGSGVPVVIGEWLGREIRRYFAKGVPASPAVPRHLARGAESGI
jgi:site-specific DNA-cytosine methylase